MPHFIIDCSATILKLKTPDEIMQNVFEASASTGLFDLSEIKVRINPFQYYTVGGKEDDFIHIFGNIMEGRTTSQKSNLSKVIVSNLNLMFPEVPVISINIRDFEKSTYFNKSML